jgi:hypothetical protein
MDVDLAGETFRIEDGSDAAMLDRAGGLCV